MDKYIRRWRKEQDKSTEIESDTDKTDNSSKAALDSDENPLLKEQLNDTSPILLNINDCQAPNEKSSTILNSKENIPAAEPSNQTSSSRNDRK